MLLCSMGSAAADWTVDEVRAGLYAALDGLGARRRVLAVPPDFTRLHSQAGLVTELAWHYYGDRLADVLPATGTHVPVTAAETAAMFGRVPRELFRAHDWRRGTVRLGEVPPGYVRDATGGAVDFGVPVELDRLLVEGGHDLVLSIGQVVPHEVVGMAGYTKNLFVGAGGPGAINRSHFLGAVCGMERIMGRADTPVRRVMNYGIGRFAGHLPVVYILTVVGNGGNGKAAFRGLFIGDDAECFDRAAALALETNFALVETPIRKCVVYLDPSEFHSTWLGNKSIYRTRMAMADGGELLVLAPGLERFGEDDAVDRLIRRYGYPGTPAVLEAVRTRPDLGESLMTAAHCIHGSTEGRFTVTYCPGRLSRREIEGVHYRYGDLAGALARYDPAVLDDGLNTMPDGEEVYYISNPALGLWAHRGRFHAAAPDRG